MSDAEGLMWRLEKDPFLSSTFSNISILDRPMNVAAFMRRMHRATIAFPRLRQRVQPAPANLGAPFWQPDPYFDLAHHVRHIALPGNGSMRQLLDLATLFTADPFDRARPPWQFLIVDNVEGGRSALISKIHHTITDGEGGVLLSMQFIDLERDAPEPAPLPEPESVETNHPDDESADVLRAALGDALRIPLSFVKQVRDALSDPASLPTTGAETAANVRAVMKQLGDTDPARSPLWTKRSLGRRLEALSVPYSTMREASQVLGGKLNTAFVTAAADAAGEYHRRLGTPIESLRTSMAVSTRTDEAASNAFTLVRLLVPTGEMPVAERFAAINEMTTSVRSGSGDANLDTLAGLAQALPISVLTRLARAQSQTVDFATSNVRGAGIPLYIAGARIAANHPVGPLGGVAFNLTLLSNDGNLDMGLHVDTAAVEQPELLRTCIEEAFARIAQFAPQPAPSTKTGAPLESGTHSPVDTGVAAGVRKRRWWRRASQPPTEST
jgi:WS/DGAT/MGAT family acyltransferase